VERAADAPGFGGLGLKAILLCGRGACKRRAGAGAPFFQLA